MTEAPGSAGLNGTVYAPGTPCWVSLMVHGLTATQEFYGKLFGWEFRPGPQQLGAYVRARLGGHEVAGIGLLPSDRHLPVAWTPYLASDDVDLTAETVRHCGGTVGVGPLVADEAGRLAIASDPSGAVFGVWQAASHLGAGITGVPGSLAWNELVTRDCESVATFYGTVFGYEEEPVVSADLDYLTLRVKGHPVAGIHGVGGALPRDRGAHWMTYFEVADVDTAVTQVVDLGGHVLEAAHESPHGRVAAVTDPEGAAFSVVRTRR
ncbi:putative enzyme related to lactoylglutathione lyase [Streptomyces sp. V3I8]|jgi:predicted enzyme related to lactoylglutathione lyase|uniref:VOC family protein n=1 Tax=Streptomyces sp. V3I8 TaxID=3042279 RepID=UPI0027830236|nr:VOC family protein [Streptomyces sp. V3I8]MDQ1035717.1 putative enzyme related to lactoylglutathione lyase [Streptomyces sp. V3I8]